MASISVNGFTGVDTAFTLSVIESSYNAVANTSSVTWSVTGTGSRTVKWIVSAVVNGTTVVSSSSVEAVRLPSEINKSGSMTISHGTDGKKTISFSLTARAFVSSPTNQKSATGSLALTNIDRTAPTVSASATVSDSVTLHVTANKTCDLFSYRMKADSGSWGSWQYYTPSPASSSANITISGWSTSATTYYVEASARRSSNHVWGYADVISFIPKGASPITSAANTVLGNAVNVKWTPQDSSFVFVLEFILKGYTHRVNVSPATTSEYTYTGWTPPKDLAQYFPNSASETMTVKLTTMHGNQTLGSSTKTFKVTASADTVPSITSVALSEGTASTFGVYVQSLSTLQAVVIASGIYSSTIKSVAMTIGGKTYTQTASGTVATVTVTSDKLSLYGDPMEVNIVVTDSRGRKATYNTNITVYRYYKPSATIDINISGDTVTTTVSGKVAPVNNLNTKYLTIQRKRLSDNDPATYTDDLSGQGYNYTSTWTQTLADIATETYLYTATIQDHVNSTTVTKQTAIVCISRLAGGKGVTLFREATDEGFWVGNIDYTISDAEYTELINMIE